MATLFPSLKPPISNKIWFTVDQNGVVDSDASLTKQELEYSLEIKEEVNKGKSILPLGKEKDKVQENGSHSICCLILSILLSLPFQKQSFFHLKLVRFYLFA